MNHKEQFYTEFYSELEKAIEPNGGKLKEMDMPKNNGSMKGITIKFDDASLAPTIYPDCYYSDWKAGYPMDKIVSDIRTEVIKAIASMSKFDISKINWDSAASHLRAAVANYDKNKEWLCHIPHERMADLALFAKWDFGNGYTAKVDPFLLAKTQHTKEEALKIAKTNSAKNFEFTNLNKIISGMRAEHGEQANMAESLMMGMTSNPLQVLTTEDNLDGAALVACPDVLRAVKDAIGEDFYILPSSIHEVLVLPKSQADDIEALKQMVSSVNEQEVAPEECLSDSVYEFDGHGIKIAGAGLDRENNISESITHHRSR